MSTESTTDDLVWSLYNQLFEIRIDGLKGDQVRALVKSMSFQALDQWLFWKEGTDEWRPLQDLLPSFGDSISYTGLSLVPLEPNPEAGQADSGSGSERSAAEQITPRTLRAIMTTNDGTAMPRVPESPPPSIADAPPKRDPRTLRSVVDLRQNQRVVLQLKVYIAIQGRLIQNETLNVSLGGMCLKHPLPHEAETVGHVILLNGEIELHMRCRVMRGEAMSDRRRLLIEACNRPDVLRAWILNGPIQSQAG